MSWIDARVTLPKHSKTGVTLQEKASSSKKNKVEQRQQLCSGSLTHCVFDTEGSSMAPATPSLVGIGATGAAMLLAIDNSWGRSRDPDGIPPGLAAAAEWSTTLCLREGNGTRDGDQEASSLIQRMGSVSCQRATVNLCQCTGLL